MAAASYTRDSLLSNFIVKAKQHYDGDLPCSMTSLLADLVSIVPHDGFQQVEPLQRLYLIGTIDDDMAEDFVDEVWQMHYYQPIDEILEIFLSSSGGSVDAGAMIAAILADVRRLGRKVHIHVAGSAMSTAFDILQSADHRSCEPTALLMTHHERFGLDETDVVNMEDQAKAGKERAKLIFQQLSVRTGRPVKFYLDKVNGRDWYVTPEEALREGLIDEIAITKPVLPLTPAREPKRTPRQPRKPKTEETVSE